MAEAAARPAAPHPVEPVRRPAAVEPHQGPQAVEARPARAAADRATAAVARCQRESGAERLHRSNCVDEIWLHDLQARDLLRWRRKLFYGLTASTTV